MYTAIEQKEDMVKEYHEALQSILSLFVSQHGWDYNLDKQINALRLRGDLPITVGLLKENGGKV